MSEIGSAANWSPRNKLLRGGEIMMQRRASVCLRSVTVRTCHARTYATKLSPDAAAAQRLPNKVMLSIAKHPYKFSMFVGCAKMALADLVAQALEARRTQPRDIDWRRVSTFATFGAVQIGLVQQFIFSTLLPTMFPASHGVVGKPLLQKLRDARGLRMVLAMTLFHELTVTPFLIFPAFYTFREFMQCDSLDVRRALSKYYDNALEDNLQSLKIFLPANFVNFLLVPPWLRAPFATAVGVGWAALLSLSRGAIEEHVGELSVEVRGDDGPPSARRQLAPMLTQKTAIIFTEHETPP